jgi:hypothetical protein
VTPTQKKGIKSPRITSEEQQHDPTLAGCIVLTRFLVFTTEQGAESRDFVIRLLIHVVSGPGEGFQTDRAIPSVAGSAPPSSPSGVILMPCTQANVWLSGDRTV